MRESGGDYLAAILAHRHAVKMMEATTCCDDEECISVSDDFF